MNGGGGFIGNRIRTKTHNRSNHLRENVNLTMQTLTRSHSCFSDIWPLTVSDGDAAHTLEAGSDSVEGRRIVNISIWPAAKCLAWHVKVYLHL